MPRRKRQRGRPRCDTIEAEEEREPTAIENENEKEDEEMIDVDETTEETAPAAADDGDDAEEYQVEEEITPRRGRPPGSKNKSTLAREMAMRARGKTGDDLDVEVVKKPRGPRGRPRASLSQPIEIPLDPEGKPYELVDDELVLDEDEEGEKKVDKNGNLLGGREYRVRTFKVKGRGDRLYMLATEPARCMGFRDSYLLFQKHRKIFKIVCKDEEKFDLIEREIIPHSYKGRLIGICAARSVFREFGARIVVGGRRVIDDYYETEAKNQGHTPDELADPDDKLPPEGEQYNRNQYVAWHGASQVYHQVTAPVTREVHKDLIHGSNKRKRVFITDENWMLEHAIAATNFNIQLRNRRLLNHTTAGVYEPHTGVLFYPASTQPTRADWFRISEKDDTANTGKPNSRVVIHTTARLPNPRTRTGLKDVDPSVFEHVNPDIKRAILEQQDYERAWQEEWSL